MPFGENLPDADQPSEDDRSHYLERVCRVHWMPERNCSGFLVIQISTDLDRGTVEIFGSRIVRVTEIGKLFEE